MILDASGKVITSHRKRYDRKRKDGDPESDGPMSVRRWEAAKTTRLNESHWATATSQSINADLQSYLDALRARCTHEIANNPILDGVVKTHTNDLVGANGPTLQVQSDNDKYNERLESEWKLWWAMPDANGRHSGAEVLDLCAKSMWANGESLIQLVQFVTKRSTEGRIGLRLRLIHPRRLKTPPNQNGKSRVVLGIRITKAGKALTYYIADENDSLGGTSAGPNSFVGLNAVNVIHDFDAQEADQIRGVPWLASSLQVIADLHDYDEQVLDAARAFADWSVTLETDHEEAQFVQVDEETEVERRTMRTLPPHYKATSLQSQQPTTQYVEYRHERMREVGHPVGMPLMMILLDSSDHNYSSARFDNQVYLRSLRKRRGAMERRILNRLVKRVALEAAIEGRPERIHLDWTWDMPPHVDPMKEAKASEIRLNAGTSTITDELAANGTDIEAHVAKLARERKLFEAAGIPYPEPKKQLPPSNQKDDDDGDNKAGSKREALTIAAGDPSVVEDLQNTSGGRHAKAS